MADNVIRANFIKTTPPSAHPALMAASDYGMACVAMANANYGTRAYDQALAECNRQWELIASAVAMRAAPAPKRDHIAECSAAATRTVIPSDHGCGRGVDCWCEEGREVATCPHHQDAARRAATAGAAPTEGGQQ